MLGHCRFIREDVYTGLCRFSASGNSEPRSFDDCVFFGAAGTEAQPLAYIICLYTQQTWPRL